jgi:hypothetical protein
MGELDLQPPFGGRRALAENLENEAGPVDHLGLGAGLQILLLNRRDRGVDDQQLGFAARDLLGQFLDLTGPEQGCGPRLANAEMELVRNLDADRLGKAGGLLQASFGVAAPLAAAAFAEIGEGDDGSGTTAKIVVRIPVEDAQAADSSSSASTRLTGCSG